MSDPRALGPATLDFASAKEEPMPTTVELAGHRILSLDMADASLDSVSDFTGLIGDALSEGVEVVAIPAEQIAEDFYQLRTGLAGEVLQKFVNYRIKLAIIGDLSQRAAQSNALRDLLVELERGTDVFVVPDTAALGARLAELFAV